MCSDASAPAPFYARPALTLGEQLDAALSAKERENVQLRQRIADIEHEVERLRRQARDND